MLNYFLTLLHLIFWVFLFYKVTKTFFNPVSLFCTALFLSVLSVYFSDLLGLLRSSNITDSFNVLYLYNLSALVFIIPWLNFKDKFLNSQKNFPIEQNLVKLTYIFIFLFIFLSFITYILMGGVPIIDMLSGNLNIVEYNELIKRLPMGMLSLFLLISTIISLLFSSFWVNRKILNYNPWFLFILFIITLISTVWQGKRQGILMLFFFVVARYFQRSSNKITSSMSFSKKIYLLVFFFLFIFFFMQIGKIRHNESSVDSSEILSYTMFPVMNFTFTVSGTKLYGNSMIPNAIINDLFPRRIADNKENKSELITFEPSSPSGYLNPWYYDYGIFGIIIGSLLLSIFSLHFYRRRNISENNMRKNILFLWCCATVGVYSHFITLNYFILPLIFIYLLDFFKGKIKHVNI